MKHPSKILGLSAGLILVTALATHGTETPTAAAATPDEATASEYTPGEPEFGTDEYIEYIPGNLPVIFAAPHGGDLKPSAIPERTEQRCGDDIATVKDVNTQELVRQIQKEFVDATGKYPHIVINRLHRDRLDANRGIDTAACGSEEAERAWTEFHDFIDTAKKDIEQNHGKGWFTDIHGHGHDKQRLELGYLLDGETLRQSDTELDDGSAETNSSLRTFSEDSELSFSELLRGKTSLGTLFEEAGYPATPSQPDPAPKAEDPFFSGGYNTQVHGCEDGGAICGLQIEHNREGVRDSEEEIADYAGALYGVYDTYLQTNFDIDLGGAELGGAELGGR